MVPFTAQHSGDLEIGAALNNKGLALLQCLSYFDAIDALDLSTYFIYAAMRDDPIHDRNIQAKALKILVSSLPEMAPSKQKKLAKLNLNVVEDCFSQETLYNGASDLMHNKPPSAILIINTSSDEKNDIRYILSTILHNIAVVYRCKILDENAFKVSDKPNKNLIEVLGLFNLAKAITTGSELSGIEANERVFLVSRETLDTLAISHSKRRLFFSRSSRRLLG